MKSVLVFVLVVVACVQAVYIHLGKGQKKCFYHDSPPGVLLIVRYSFLDQILFSDTKEGIVSSIYEAVSPRDIDKMILNSDSIITHRVHTINEGIKKICVEPTYNFFNMYAGSLLDDFIRLQIEILDETKVDEKLAKAIDRDQLHASREQILSLITHTSNILKEQEYEKIKAEIGEEKLKQLDRRILWLTILQIIVIIASAGFLLKIIRDYIAK
ncbi:unnamed protein product [Moneuplotes crassus]|uniref:GOLD domain-containing protein n=1 Tax=Euplotes crassus TaxID=5936 RepID=A0AAD1XU49_EUPCR|nr:unnamed protein product [Moneuplotes crassus]